VTLPVETAKMLSTLALRKVGQTSLQHVRFCSALATANKVDVLVVPEGSKLPYQDLEASSDPIPQTLEQKVQNWKNANDVFFGPDRDFKNYPHPEYKDHPTETYQFGFIPTRWFNHLYPRLGVTGSYTLIWGTFLMAVSKGFFPLAGLTLKYFSWVAIGSYVLCTTKLSQKFTEKLDKGADELDDHYFYKPLREAKTEYLEELEALNVEIARKDAVPAIFQAKEEQLDLQLETEYRQRLNNAFTQVKNRLDYQADVDQVERQFEQDHMVNWIVTNVKKSITPQQEKETIASCIGVLKNLSATATI